VQRAQGRLDAAEETYRQALEIYGPHGRPVPSAAGVGYVGLAEVAYQRNELDTALRHVSEAIPLRRQFVFTPPLAAGLAVLAWIRQAQGEAAGARPRQARRSQPHRGRHPDTPARPENLAGPRNRFPAAPPCP